MSDSLSKGFYNGKANPFELHQFKLVTSVKELERSFPGPKVVIQTYIYIYRCMLVYECMFICVYSYIFIYVYKYT
jgi:hypothetical protein